MWTASTIADARNYRRALRGSVAFIPTMGALHDGHVALIHAGKKLADHAIVSVFVNPTQFGPHEDFSRYPRPLERDLEHCKQAGAAGVFVPTVEAMYPPNRMACDVNIPSMANILEGEFRPGHFAGVCRVVAKLLNIVQPDVACFGQKDWQQLKVIEAMVADLDLPVRIAGLPTVRENDGLAKSSRNIYLDTDARRRATALFKSLTEARELVEVQGETDPRRVEAAMRQVLTAHHFEIDYAVVRHPHTLSQLDVIAPRATAGVVALIAARVGTVRLIDNMLLGAATS
jgi:pantoate--beta-alanine ligase